MPRFQKTLRQAIVIGYLGITLTALLYTLFRIQLPLVPSFLMHFSYGMMAPYQGDNERNDDLYAEGELPDGHRARIDLAPYFPYGFGERNVRMYLRSFSPDSARRHQGYVSLAEQLLVSERKLGTPYVSLKLYGETWPRSPAGFEALRVPAFVSRQFLAEAQ